MGNGPITLGRIESMYRYYPPNAFMLVDVRCNYIPVRRTFSAGLVISPHDKILLNTAMYVGPIQPSVTWP